jgi:hypothetical protein
MWRVITNWAIVEVTSFRRGPATWDSPGGTFLLDDDVIVSSKRMFAKLADAVAYADRRCDDDVDECRSIVKQYSDRLRLLKKNKEANHLLLDRVKEERDAAQETVVAPRDRVDGDAVQDVAAVPFPGAYTIFRSPPRSVSRTISPQLRALWVPGMDGAPGVDTDLPDRVPANEAEPVAGVT